MPLGHHALTHEIELAVEDRRGETLSPNLLLDQHRGLPGELGAGERAVRFDRSCQIGGRQPFPAHALEGSAEALESVRCERQPGCRRMAAEAREQSRITLRDQVERVAKMQSGDRTSRSAERSVRARCEHDRRSLKALFQARRYDADYPLMPIRIVDTDAEIFARVEPIELRERGELHRRLDRPTLAVQAVQLLRDIECTRL